MSTNSVVAIPTATGWKGRHVHINGFPTWVGKQLHALVNRDGYNAVVSTIVTGENYGWSSLNCRTPGDITAPEYLDDCYATVPGYGIAYASIMVGGVETFATTTNKTKWYTDKDVVDSGAEWVYVLGETGMDVYTAYFPLTKVGHVRYDMNTDSFDAIEESATASWV